MRWVSILSMLLWQKVKNGINVTIHIADNFKSKILARQDPELLGLIMAFLAVVETGSFAAAAKVLRQTPSTISRKVIRLEENLGVRLLNRTTRSVVITEIGAIYLRYCQSVNELLRSAEAEVVSLSRSPQGLLRLSMPVAFGQRYMTPLLAEFLEQYPKVEIEAAYNDRYVQMVEENIDLSIRIGDLPDSSLVARKVMSNQRLLVASPEYIEKFGAPKHPSELSNYDCIRYTRYRSAGNIWRFIKDGEDREEISATVNGSFRCDDSAAVLTYVQAGAGIGIVADYICYDALMQARLIHLMPEWRVLPASGIYLCWPSTRLLMPKVRYLIDFLAVHLQHLSFNPPRKIKM